MKAAVWHGYKDIRIEDVPVPDVRPGHVLIRVAYAGICGTDRHEYVGPNFIPAKKPHRLTGKMAPLTMGHEFSGTIAKLGEHVEGWRVGARVTANGTLCCGACEQCKSGRYNICEKLGFVGVSRDGTFAEFVEIEAARLFAIPENVTLRQAVVAEPLACGIHATRLLGGTANKDVVIIGPGVIGLSCFFGALFSGARRLLVSGVGGERRALVERYGGTYIDAAREDLPAAVRAWADGRLADIVYECVGTQRTLDQSIAIMKPGAKLMVMGVFEESPLFPMNDFQEGERQLYTSQAHVDEIATALDYLADGRIDGDELITREVTLSTLVQDGFEELLHNAPRHIKIIIRIAGGE